MSVFGRCMLAIVSCLVAFQTCSAQGGVGPGGVQAPWCYQDNDDTTCAQAVAAYIVEGTLSEVGAEFTVGCNGCTVPDPPLVITCDDVNKLWPVPAALQLEFAIGFPENSQGTNNGSDDVEYATESIDCGTMRQCNAFCTLNQFLGVWECSSYIMSSNLAVHERWEAGDPCTFTIQ